MSCPLNECRIGANGRTRTDKPKRKILSLLCLPISPHSQKHYYTLNKLACQLVPLLRFELRESSPFERDDFTNLSTEAFWWVCCELNTDSTDYESAALPLSYRPKVAEDVRVELTQRYNSLYGLAIRCITILPIFLTLAPNERIKLPTQRS